MSDLNERPAVPELDSGADERYGYFIAGALLIALGWGFGVVLNVLLHRAAPAAGLMFGPWSIHSGFGPFAWATAIIGTVTGMIGVVLLYFGGESPKGEFVLPGQPY